MPLSLTALICTPVLPHGHQSPDDDLVFYHREVNPSLSVETSLNITLFLLSQSMKIKAGDVIQDARTTYLLCFPKVSWDIIGQN